MWWVLALICGLVVTWGFEIRMRDFMARIDELGNTIGTLKDEIAALKKDLTGPVHIK